MLERQDPAKKVTTMFNNELYQWAHGTRFQYRVTNYGDVKYAGAVYEVRTYGSVRGMRHEPHPTRFSRVYI